MASKIFEIELTGFSFPNNLDKSMANFRFVVDLRFIDAKGDPSTIHTILPGLDDFWECDPREREKDKALFNYVREPADDTTAKSTSPSFNMANNSSKNNVKEVKLGQVRDWDNRPHESL